MEIELSSGDIWNNPIVANQKNSELNALKKNVTGFQEVHNNLIEYRDLLIEFDDEDLVNEIELKMNELEKIVDDLEISNLLNGKYDGYNCYLEIHPGAGGTEACDWAGMLARMYQMFCNKNDYKYEIIDIQDGEEAGLKNIIMKISGNYPYGFFKGEQGVHRLVRISPFDSNARRHTSFAAVSVIPEIDTEISIEIKADDIRVDVYRASGKGGQGVNTTDSAVRLTHIPTGTVVTCQNERSQIKNKERAMKVLKAKIYDNALQEYAQKSGQDRKSAIGTGDRSEKIRTYNYAQNRVTDHRINFSIMQLDYIMEGDIEPIINALITEDQRRKLSGEE